MTFDDIIDFFASLIGSISVSVFSWVERTAYMVADIWFMVYQFLNDWIWKVEWFLSSIVESVMILHVSLFEAVRWLFVDNMDQLYHLFHDYYGHLCFLAGYWEETLWPWMSSCAHNLEYLARDWWAAIEQVFGVHPDKLLYILTDGWLRYVWLVIDRWEDLYGVIETHLEGWRTFAEDPAQAIWDWVEPRLQQLLADFLVRLW